MKAERLTPAQVAAKYQRPDGSLDLPPNVRIVMPTKPSTASVLAAARAQKNGQ